MSIAKPARGKTGLAKILPNPVLRTAKASPITTLVDRSVFTTLPKLQVGVTTQSAMSVASRETWATRVVNKAKQGVRLPQMSVVDTMMASAGEVAQRTKSFLGRLVRPTLLASTSCITGCNGDGVFTALGILLTLAGGVYFITRVSTIPEGEADEVTSFTVDRHRHMKVDALEYHRDPDAVRMAAQPTKELAETLAEKLTPRSPIILVGHQRSGKTTLLRLIQAAIEDVEPRRLWLIERFIDFRDFDSVERAGKIGGAGYAILDEVPVADSPDKSGGQIKGPLRMMASDFRSLVDRVVGEESAQLVIGAHYVAGEFEALAARYPAAIVHWVAPLNRNETREYVEDVLGNSIRTDRGKYQPPQDVTDRVYDLTGGRVFEINFLIQAIIDVMLGHREVRSYDGPPSNYITTDTVEAVASRFRKSHEDRILTEYEGLLASPAFHDAATITSHALFILNNLSTEQTNLLIQLHARERGRGDLPDKEVEPLLKLGYIEEVGGNLRIRGKILKQYVGTLIHKGVFVKGRETQRIK